MIDEKKLASAAMNDDELDKVAGGSCTQTSNDSKLLYDHGLVDDWHSTLTTSVYWKDYSAAVDAGWAKVGITCVTKYNDNNLYFKDGKQISRDEAVAHVKANFSKIRDWND